MDTQHAQAFQFCGWDVRTNPKSCPGDNITQHTSTSTKSCANHSDETQTTSYDMIATSSRKKNKICRPIGCNKEGKYKSGYKLFFSETYAQVKQQVMEENPRLKFGEVSKRVGELWASCSENEKNYYRRRIFEEKAEILKTREISINTPSTKTKICNKAGYARNNASEETPTSAITPPDGQNDFSSIDFDSLDL